MGRRTSAQGRWTWYGDRTCRFAEWCFERGILRARDLTADDLEDFVLSLQIGPYKPPDGPGLRARSRNARATGTGRGSSPTNVTSGCWRQSPRGSRPRSARDAAASTPRSRWRGLTRRCPCLYDEACGFRSYDTHTWSSEDGRDYDERNAIRCCPLYGKRWHDPLPELLSINNDALAARWIEAQDPARLWSAARSRRLAFLDVGPTRRRPPDRRHRPVQRRPDVRWAHLVARDR